jgi:hypothetical protein
VNRAPVTFGLTLANRGVLLGITTPALLLELAERAGLRLAERYADWDRRPFDRDSRSHISVYRGRPA